MSGCILGLTGGIGCGKSTVAAALAARGWTVIDTDVLARELVAPGSPATLAIARAFGDGMLGADGAPDRRKLADRVFRDPDARRQLESILHPPIRAAWLARARADAARGRLVTVVIPLLYETGAEAEVDAVACVACSPGVQAERLRARGWSADDIRGRLAAQWPLQRKMDLADVVFWNDGTLEVLEAQVDAWVARRADIRKNSTCGPGKPAS
jgi:dephospho-CoA kinase